MKEELLHTIWNQQLYNVKELESSKGECLDILFRGIHNHHDGPDFLEAKVQVDKTILFGSIEIHVNSSDWIKHNHSIDVKYKNVILHVVWNHDMEINDLNCPTLVLRGRIPKYYFDNYLKLKSQAEILPCSTLIRSLDDSWLQFYKEKININRLISKRKFLDKNFSPIKLTKIYESFLYTFGLIKNINGFVRLSELLPYRLLQKYSNNKHKIEALLYGVSGFLSLENTDLYFLQLKTTYYDLKHTHNLNELGNHIWIFLRIRPNVFPTLKLAFLADFFHKIPSIENFILTESICEIQNTLNSLQPSNYWLTHYTFNKSSKMMSKGLGKVTINNLFINCVLPLRQLYSNNIESSTTDSLDYLRNNKSEMNSITRRMVDNGFINNNAFDSQFLIHKNKNYCIDRNCLNCGIGLRILKRNDKQT